jgi:hypothetical protein
MLACADEINALLRESILLICSEGGEFSFGPSSSDAFYERFSWLDAFSKLYLQSDDLKTRLEKFIDYVKANRENGGFLNTARETVPAEPL